MAGIGMVRCVVQQKRRAGEPKDVVKAVGYRLPEIGTRGMQDTVLGWRTRGEAGNVTDTLSTAAVLRAIHFSNLVQDARLGFDVADDVLSQMLQLLDLGVVSRRLPFWPGVRVRDNVRGRARVLSSGTLVVLRGRGMLEPVGMDGIPFRKSAPRDITRIGSMLTRGQHG